MTCGKNQMNSQDRRNDLNDKFTCWIPTLLGMLKLNTDVVVTVNRYVIARKYEIQANDTSNTLLEFRRFCYKARSTHVLLRISRFFCLVIESDRRLLVEVIHGV